MSEPPPTAVGVQTPNSGHEVDLGTQAIKTMSHLGLAALFSMAMGLVIRLILPRAIGRDALGVLYFAESFSAMFFTVLPLGVTAYIVREIPLNHGKISRILPTLLPATALWGVCIWLIMLVALWFTGAELDALYCCAAMGVFNGCASLQRAILRRSYVAIGDSAQMARQEMAVRIALIFMIFGCLWLRTSVVVLATAYATSELLGVSFLVWRSKRLGYLSGRFDIVLLRQIVTQSLPFFAVGAMVEIYGNVNTTMLNFIAGNSEVAYFGAADRLKGMALLLVPVMQAGLQPALSKAWHQSKEQFTRLVKHAVRLLVVLSMPLTLGLMILPDMIADTIFGSEYRASYRAICYLAPVLSLTYLNVLLGSCLNIISDGRKFVVVTGFSLLLNIGLNLQLAPFCMKLWGEGGAAAGSALATVVAELFVVVAIQHIFPVAIDFSRVAKMILASAAPCLLAGIYFDVIQQIAVGWRIVVVGITPVYGIIVSKLADIKAHSD
ncbi:MAG: hypothetical protein FJ146_01760 [Deltaproteobacteria bacterium]|nr:hypothetical protein [Deltaproteobacteria bacterium]